MPGHDSICEGSASNNKFVSVVGIESKRTMVLDQLPFDYLSSIRTWIQVTGILTALSLLTILLQASINQGSFGRGFQEWKQQLAEIAQDVVQLSMSRLFSLIRHSVKESFHRKVLYVFVVFAIDLYFSGFGN